MTPDLRRALAYGLPVTWIVTLLAVGRWLGPPARLLGATAVLLAAIKVGAWLLVRASDTPVELTPLEMLLFWTVWPGIRPDRFGAASDAPTEPNGRDFAVGWCFVLAGAGLVVLSLLAPPWIGALASTWLLLAGLLGVVHFGIGRILPFCLRVAGVPAPALFEAPLASRSVAAFWSERWNRPFVAMNRLFVTRPLAGRWGMAVAAPAGFLVSGALHELAISFPADDGWGGPMAYFVLQAVLYAVERWMLPSRLIDGPIASRAWTYAAVLGPVPLLFHGPFRATFLLPIVEAGRGALLAAGPGAVHGAALWVGAAGHALVLVASSQVPGELEWREDLRSLRPLNRKLMWTYGGFIVLTIVSFGLLTALFHGAFVDGTSLATGVAAAIAVFWTARILVDLLYFDHEDWPTGPEYVAGRVLLTSLFGLLVAIYGGTVVVHLL